MTKIAVLGAGSWGTALAMLMARNGHDVLLWGHHPEHMQNLRVARCNERYLPGVPFPETLAICSDLAETAGAEMHLVGVPSHAFRQTLLALRPHLRLSSSLGWATKGLELESGMMLHQVAEEVLGSEVPLAVLSGPSFAKELAANLPTAITVAARLRNHADVWVNVLHNTRFRAYSSEDVVGVQLGGATKNVLAIAAGVADGLGFGANARAALITRGLAEMIRLGLALGGKPDTFMGLAGVGDLILTCTDNQSRNRRFGLGLGRGLSRDEVVREIGQEIEGILTAKVIHELARRNDVEMPITEQTYRILYEGLPAVDAVENLLIRDPKPEGIH